MVNISQTWQKTHQYTNSMTHNTKNLSFNGKQSKIKTKNVKDTVVMGQCKQCAKLWPRSHRLTVVFKKGVYCKNLPILSCCPDYKKYFLNVFCLILCAFRFFLSSESSTFLIICQHLMVQVPYSNSELVFYLAAGWCAWKRCNQCASSWQVYPSHDAAPEHKTDKVKEASCQKAEATLAPFFLSNVQS